MIDLDVTNPIIRIAVSQIIWLNTSVNIDTSNIRFVSFTNEFQDVMENENEFGSLHFEYQGNLCKCVRVIASVNDLWDFVICTHHFLVN